MIDVISYGYYEVLEFCVSQERRSSDSRRQLCKTLALQKAQRAAHEWERRQNDANPATNDPRFNLPRT